MQQLIFLSLNTETPVIMIPQKKKWGGGKTPIFFVVGNFKVIGFCWLHNKKKNQPPFVFSLGFDSTFN